MNLCMCLNILAGDHSESRRSIAPLFSGKLVHPWSWLSISNVTLRILRCLLSVPDISLGGMGGEMRYNQVASRVIVLEATASISLLESTRRQGQYSAKSSMRSMISIGRKLSMNSRTSTTSFSVGCPLYDADSASFVRAVDSVERVEPMVVQSRHMYFTGVRCHHSHSSRRKHVSSYLFI